MEQYEQYLGLAENRFNWCKLHNILEESAAPILSSTNVGKACRYSCTRPHGSTFLKSLFYMVSWLGIEFIWRQFSSMLLIWTTQNQSPFWTGVKRISTSLKPKTTCTSGEEVLVSFGRQVMPVIMWAALRNLNVYQVIVLPAMTSLKITS